MIDRRLIISYFFLRNPCSNTRRSRTTCRKNHGLRRFFLNLFSNQTKGMPSPATRTPCILKENLDESVHTTYLVSSITIATLTQPGQLLHILALIPKTHPSSPTPSKNLQIPNILTLGADACR